MPGFTGTWARQQAALVGGDPDRFTVSGPTDPGHGDKSDAPAPLMMDAPQAQGGGELHTDALWENFHHLPPSTLIDKTPISGHGTPQDAGHGYGGCYIPGASIDTLAYYRGMDNGAADKQTQTDAKYRFNTDAFYGFALDAFRDVPLTRMGVGNPVYVRGVNGHPVNNGDGGRPTSWTVDSPEWHLGTYEESKIDRPFEPPSFHHRDVKKVEADIITIIGDAPPPDRSDTYASPFSALQKFMPKRRKVRGIRRDPGPIDEDQLALNPSSYTGTGVDGMVVN